MLRMLCLALLMACCASASHARTVTLATWNLGWHMDLQTVQKWIGECGKSYIEDPATGTWSQSSAPGSKPGWDVSDTFSIQGWDTANLPVCGVYFDRAAVHVTLDAYKKRQQQIATFIRKSVPADIIAFQEVSGVEAVKEILPDGGIDYELCGLSDPDKYKVQRLVIAWKKAIGTQVDCSTERDLSLPANPVEKQPRPGLAVTIKVGGTELRILNVHLKSSCVSPFDGGKLEGNKSDCQILQQQLTPIENWIEAQATADVKFVLMGDFNRNLSHELRDQSPVRTDLSDPSGPRPANALSRSLIEELADGVPASTALTVLDEECDTSAIGQLLCLMSEQRPLTSPERSLLASREYLGCRNPVGLDHIVVGPGVKVDDPAKHTSIGIFGGTRSGDDSGQGQILAISDHCPLSAKLEL